MAEYTSTMAPSPRQLQRFDYLGALGLQRTPTDTVDGIQYVVAWCIFILWCFQWTIHLTSIVYGKIKLHHRPSLSLESLLPSISVLKPLNNVDQNLYANLETFFNMKYPKYELLFCVEDEMDPAIMIVRSLLAKYPKVDAQLFVGGAKRYGVNPKINNMVQGYDVAKYDLILISDSGLKMKEDTLLDMVSMLKDSVGLVHQMPFVCDRVGFAATLEKVYFGSQHAKIYLMSDLLGINCVTGMSCLFRKKVIEQIGGLKSLGVYLAEDYHLAQVFFDRGWRVRICSQPALQNAGNYSVGYFQDRMIRWIKLRTSLIPLTVLLEPVSECLLLGVFSAWSVSRLFGWSGLAFFFVHSLLWFLLDYILLLTVQGGPVPFSKMDFVSGWLFREIFSLTLMARAHATRILTWRSRQYVIRRGGIGEELKIPAQQQRLFV